MTEVRALIEQLVRAGIDPIEAAEIITRAAIIGASTAPRSSAAIRQERYRHNKASQTVTGDVSDAEAVPPKEVSPAPLQEITPSEPTTPKENPLRGQKKAVRLPTDFAPDLVWAAGQGLTPSQAETEAAKFRDYWTAKGRDATKSDWAATWRNWVRTALERLPRQREGPVAKANPALDAANRLMEQLDAVTPSETQTNPAYPRLVAFSGGG